MIKITTRRLIFLLSILFISNWLHAYDGAVDDLLQGTIVHSGSGTKAALAFDGDASTTYYSNSGSEMQWIGLDLGEPYVITRVGYTPASGSEGADRVLLSLFEGANRPDFMDAMPLYFISTKPANGTATKADVNVSRGFRYVRYVGSAGSYCNIADLEFYGHAGEGDDSQFYQITNLPTLSIHVQNNIKPTVRGEDHESLSTLIYDGGTMVQEYPILFRVRGNFSSSPENKAYRMKYNDGKSHHVMRGGHNESPTKCKKWVLINSYRDKTLMRNPVAWAMSKRVEMHWTPWSQIVDLVVNGDYRGTYTLADAVSLDPNRIDITEMGEWDTDEETITGGYLAEVDNNASREPYWFSSTYGNPISIHEPDDDVMQSEQFQYIKNTWNNMESIVFGSNYTDWENGQRSVLDIESFLRYFLASEFNGNTDMLCQVFMYKERGDDHFYTGPVWDAELALENDQTTYPANERMDWTYKVRDTGNWSQFVGRVISDPSVFAQLQEMWAILRKKGAFEPDDVAADVDSLRTEVRASANLNFIRWPYLTQYISLNPEIPGSWEAEVDRVRDFVYDRVAWMDEMLSYGKVHQKDGIYQIASALDLCTFSQMVNEGGKTDADAVLLADIDMTNCNEDFQPIGTSSAIFTGSLDGEGHVIRNLHLSSSNSVGLFGYVGTCTLCNIVFDETCSAKGANKVGMLVGYVRDGTATISGIENHGSVSASVNGAGGIVGNIYPSVTVNITNCCNTGDISASSGAGALVGSSNGYLTVENSYNIGTVTGSTEDKEFAYANNGTSINNCWDYTSSQTNNMTPEQVDNGYLCYHINTNAGSTIWHQNIDNGRVHNPWPVLWMKGGNVYEKDGQYTNYNPIQPKFRYYNLIVTSLQGSTRGCIQFSEFDILNERGEEVEALYIYDGTDSNIGHEDWPNAADNNVKTKYCCSAFNGYAYFLFDAKSSVSLCGYRIYTANDTGTHSERNPSSWRLYGSNTQLYDPEDPEWELIEEREDDWTLQATNYTPYDFYISDPIKTLTLNNQTATIMRGEKLRLEATFTPNTLQGLTLQWSTTDPSVATVNSQGLVLAKAEGTADIIVTTLEDETLRDTCTVTVVAKQPGFRYYQFAIEEVSGNSAIQLSEIDLLDGDGNEITPLTLYAYTGTHYSDEVQANLFDDNVYTKYCGPFSAVNPVYIYIDAGQRVLLSGYRFTTANDTQSNPGRNPITWSLLGSNTPSELPNDVVWTLLDRREKDTTLEAANYEPYDFIIPEPVLMGDVNSDGEVDLSDAVMVTCYSLQMEPDNFNEAAADMNNDGEIDLSDAIIIIYTTFNITE
ncbi:MAG: CotH kinase family protein [Bacteroidaceae bacterium]|nr:CotH kinase family protein [Bacteroidaceae bacterium]